MTVQDVIDAANTSELMNVYNKPEAMKNASLLNWINQGIVAIAKKIPLIDNEKVASKALAEYLTWTDQSEKNLAKKKILDASMADNAAIFMKNAEDYLDSQEIQLKQERRI